MKHNSCFKINKTQYLIIEIMVLFFVLPLIFIPIAKNNMFVLMLSLGAISALCMSVLFKQHFYLFDNRQPWHDTKKGAINIIIESLLAMPLIILLVYIFDSELLFYHVKINFSVWLMLWIIYPLFSVLPQEIIFRLFIFERYKLLIPKESHRALLSCFSFGFLHIIFRNWQAVLLSALASIVFCITYLKYRSLLLVTIEHSCFGLIAYTSGLGYYFDSSFID